MIRSKQLLSTDLIPTEDTEDEVGVGVGVLTLVTADWERVVAGMEEVEGPKVDWVID